MHLSKADIFQATIVGLAFAVSAVAVPVIGSGSNQAIAKPNIQNTQQVAQSPCFE